MHVGVVAVDLFQLVGDGVAVAVRLSRIGADQRDQRRVAGVVVDHRPATFPQTAGRGVAHRIVAGRVEELLAVQQPVPVAVGRPRIKLVEDLPVVRQAVAVVVDAQGIGAVLHFPEVVEAVAVAVSRQVVGVGALERLVAQAVAVGILQRREPGIPAEAVDVAARQPG